MHSLPGRRRPNESRHAAEPGVLQRGHRGDAAQRHVQIDPRARGRRVRAVSLPHATIHPRGRMRPRDAHARIGRRLHVRKVPRHPRRHAARVGDVPRVFRGREPHARVDHRRGGVPRRPQGRLPDHPGRIGIQVCGNQF